MKFIARESFRCSQPFTEFHALTMLEQSFCSDIYSGMYYFAFPWTSLITAKLTGNALEQQALKSMLYNVPRVLDSKGKVITVVQHKDLEYCLPELKAAGVTDIFWCYAGSLDNITDFVIHPFPMFPGSSNDELNHLWLAINNLAKPVLQNEKYLLPGLQDLWNHAGVFRDVSHGMEHAAEGEHWQGAVKQIKELYGKDYFVYDIEQFVLKHAAHYYATSIVKTMAADLLTDLSSADKSLLQTSCSSHKLLKQDPASLLPVKLALGEITMSAVKLS